MINWTCDHHNLLRLEPRGKYKPRVSVSSNNWPRRLAGMRDRHHYTDPFRTDVTLVLPIFVRNRRPIWYSALTCFCLRPRKESLGLRKLDWDYSLVSVVLRGWSDEWRDTRTSPGPWHMHTSNRHQRDAILSLLGKNWLMVFGLNILYPVEPPVDWNAEPFELRLPSGTKLQPFRIPFLD
jgi:hypothetical protein